MYQKSFEKVKGWIISSPVMFLFDYKRRHWITADASCYTLGAVLLQDQGDGVWKPVAFSLRRLTEAERRYGQIEKEVLVIT